MPVIVDAVYYYKLIARVADLRNSAVDVLVGDKNPDDERNLKRDLVIGLTKLEIELKGLFEDKS